MKTRISLYGDESEQFDRIKSEIEEYRGHTVSNAEVVRILMGEYAGPNANNLL